MGEELHVSNTNEEHGHGMQASGHPLMIAHGAGRGVVDDGASPYKLTRSHSFVQAHHAQKSLAEKLHTCLSYIRLNLDGMTSH